MWKNGRTPTTVSSWVTGCWAVDCRMLATRLRWLSITPLGRPVVPLEYGSATRSSGSGLAAGGRGVAPADAARGQAAGCRANRARGLGVGVGAPAGPVDQRRVVAITVGVLEREV